MPEPSYSPKPGAPPAPESVFVHGTDEAAVAALAAALALASHRGFSWADCARHEAAAQPLSHWIFARGSERPGVERVEEAMLRASRWDGSARAGLLTGDPKADPERLTVFLRLPELFQRLGSQAVATDGRSAVLLANVDALGTSGAVLSDPSLHTHLHSAGISLFATTVEDEPLAAWSSFDRSFRVEVPEGEPWSRGLLTVEKGAVRGSRHLRLSVRDAWSALGLDGSFLPPL